MPTPVPRVISVSRRTDIPAFYSAWLLNRLRAGFCHVANPFGGKVARVSLLPQDCLALVFWTRNPAPLLPHLDFLRTAGYRHYTQMTITGYPRVLEPHGPPMEEALDAFRRLAEATAPEFVVWRYDPILLSSLTPAEDHLQRFAALAAQLAGYTRRCLVSFTDLYGKTARNLTRLTREHGIQWHAPTLEEQRTLLHALVKIATGHGITLQACCEPELLDETITQAHCIDPTLIRQLRPDLDITLRATPSRPDCGCAISTDIGAYDTCLHGCAYCYATNSHATACARHRTHDPADTLLWRSPALLGVELG